MQKVALQQCRVYGGDEVLHRSAQSSDSVASACVLQQ